MLILRRKIFIQNQTKKETIKAAVVLNHWLSLFQSLLLSLSSFLLSLLLLLLLKMIMMLTRWDYEQFRFTNSIPFFFQVEDFLIIFFFRSLFFFIHSFIHSIFPLFTTTTTATKQQWKLLPYIFSRPREKKNFYTVNKCYCQI